MRETDPTAIFDAVAGHDAVRTLASALRDGRAAGAVGASGSSTAVVCAAIAKLTGRTVVALVAHLDDADEAVDEINAAGVGATRLPALEALPGETGVSLDLLGERLSVVRRVVSGEIAGAHVVVCPMPALMQTVPRPDRLGALTLRLAPGDARAPGDVVRWLTTAGFRRLDSIEEPGDFAVRGGIIDVFPPGAESATGGAVRLDFFGDEIESVTEIDLDTMGSDRRLDSVELVGATAEGLGADDSGVAFAELLPAGALGVICETLEVVEQGRGYYERVTDARGILGPPAVLKGLRQRLHAVAEINQFNEPVAEVGVRLPVRPLPEFSRDASEAMGDLGALAETGRVIVLCDKRVEAERLGALMAEFAPDASGGAEWAEAYLHRGFTWGDDESGALHAAPWHEVLHRYQTRRRIRRIRGGRSTDSFIELEVGDHVVHQDHGVAKFTGLKSMKPRAPRATAAKRTEETLGKGAAGGAKEPGGHEEYLTLEFAKGAKLHVPVSQIDKVQKYVGGFQGKPPLSAIGGRKWETQKQKVGESVRELAAELLRVQAARESTPGVRYPADTAWQAEFEAEFPYDETEDQLAALAEIKRDMQSARPMDRLLCGDVGYGKTELAIRAAFKAVESGRQVAVLVPTTILAEQHERTFRERFAPYPFVVESLSRFKSRGDQNDVLMRTRKGQVDILVGTHRILSKDVRFADLGLVVVDEEQRFGVEHKQSLLRLRMTADVLTLSATPIPRTLHMSMLGLRDISSLSTAPLDRRAVVTEVIPFNEKRVERAIARELAREGQVFFVHNRVHNIMTVADDVRRLAPGARVVVGHGQMPIHELEEVMGTFVRREADILVCTTIIESGIDIPTANTMIIRDADLFGLAELHQLRGRVGRYKHRAYCYLLLPADRPVTEVATRRLRAIEEFSMLGAGFKIAMRDLEIRGAGNLLGAEQSGHIAAVGYDMYCRLLERAARELRSEPVADPSETTVEIGLSGTLPKAYIPSDARRLEAYRRLATARTTDELRAFERDLAEAYGDPPAPARRLLELAEMRVRAFPLGIRSIAVHEADVVIRCADPAPVVAALEGARGAVRPLSGADADGLREVYYRPPEAYLEPATLATILTKRFREAGEAAPSGAA